MSVDFGKNISRERKKRGLTVKEVSAHTTINVETIKADENNEILLGLARVILYADCFGVTVDVLLLVGKRDMPRVRTMMIKEKFHNL